MRIRDDTRLRPLLVAGSLLWGWLMVLAGGSAQAADVKVLSANGVKAVIGELVPRFEQATGHKVVVSLGEAGELRHRILDGEAFDLGLLPAAVLSELVKQGKIAEEGAQPIARTDVGVAIRADAGRPDLGSTEALKQLFLAAKTIVITDPSSGGVSGVHIAEVFQRLGIADEVKPKLKLTRGVLNAELVARGEADLAVQLAHEIRAIPGVAFVALPTEFRRSIVFSGGVAAGAAQGGAARDLLAFVAGATGRAVIAEKGMEPAAGQ